VNHRLTRERKSTFALLLLSLGLAEAGQTAIGGEIGARIFRDREFKAWCLRSKEAH
jgi:hypothetical protein